MSKNTHLRVAKITTTGPTLQLEKNEPDFDHPAFMKAVTLLAHHHFNMRDLKTHEMESCIILYVPQDRFGIPDIPMFPNDEIWVPYRPWVPIKDQPGYVVFSKDNPSDFLLFCDTYLDSGKDWLDRRPDEILKLKS